MNRSIGRATVLGQWALLALSIAGTLGLLSDSTTATADATLPFLLLAVLPLVTLVVAQRYHDALPTWAVVASSAFLVGAAMVAAPHGSNDVWSYAMYGRIVAVHHANPYIRPPAAFPYDVALTRVAHVWRGTPSVYGPGFTALSALVMAVVGTSAIATRLVFQALAGSALLGSVVLLARAGVRGAGLLPIAINPLLIIWVVNGAHNDALVGLALLGAALAMNRNRHLTAAGCICAALMVKAVAGLPLLALSVYIWRRRGPASAAKFVAVATGPVLVGYLAFGGFAAIRPLRSAASNVSRSSIWRLLLEVLPTSAHRFALAHLSALVVLAILTVSTAALLQFRRRGRPSQLVPQSLLGYLLAGAYVLPWYLAWALPASALDGRSLQREFLLIESCVLLVAYQYQTVPNRDMLDRGLSFGVYAAASVLLAMCIAIVVSAAIAVGRGKRSSASIGKVASTARRAMGKV